MAVVDNTILNQWLSQVVASQATDLHLSVGVYPFMRYDGNLRLMESEAVITNDFLKSLLLDLLTEEDQAHLERERRLEVVHVFNKSMKFKVKVWFQRNVLSISFHYISEILADLTALGLPGQLADLVAHKHGLLVVNGPYDSGRSTTLVALINSINQRFNRSVLLLEDPIERIFISTKSVIEQRQIRRDVPSFGHGLNEVFDSDVEVVVLTEVSDFSVLEKVFKLLESGRLVIMVTSGYSTISLVQWFLSLFPADSKVWAQTVLAQHLLAIVTQRLVPKLGGGRVLAVELLTNLANVRSVLASGNWNRLVQLLQSPSDQGLISLERSLALLVRKGEVKINDALEQADQPDLLRQLIR